MVQAHAHRPVTESDEWLQVDGALPADLGGCFLQSFTHPVAAAGLTGGVSAGPHVLSGIRLGEGRARWHRARMSVRRDALLGPVPPLAPAMWPGSGAPDRLGPVSVACPVRDTTGAWHTIVTYPGLDYAEHLTADSDGDVSHASPFPLQGAPLMQAVALTTRYVVVFDLPVVHRQAAALMGSRFPYAWQAGRPARIGLLSRNGGVEPRWFEVEPCYVSHAVNAYEEDGQVVVDAVRHARAFDGASSGAEPSHLRRWTLDLATGAAGERPVIAADRTSQESALVDERVRGRSHRHVFGSRDRAAGSALVRHDLLTGATETWELGEGVRVDPPVFAPRAAQGEAASEGVEGDGWLMAVAHDAVRRVSELLVFDALDLAAGPRASVCIPGGSPVGCRVAWLPSLAG